MAGFGMRMLWGCALAMAAALIVLALGGGVQVAVVTAIGGIAATLVAAGGDEVLPAIDAAAPATDPLLLDEILDGVGEPILLLRDGRIERANRAARALLGNHIVGEDARIAIRHPAAADRLTAGAVLPAAPIALVGIGALDQRWEMRVAAASDGQRIVHLVDLTDNDAAERMRVDFVANASHELRTPLASILGFIETLGEEAGEDPAIRARFLKVMNDEARRMQRLVEDLISLSRIEATKYRLPEVPVDLTELIAQVCTELTDSGHPRAGDVECDVPGGLPQVAGDRAQLSQMLHNLVGNAVKYGRPATPVAVRLARDDAGFVRLSVTDQGEGIPSVHIPRLTERFYRVDAGRSRSLGGTGLGLAIVKHIVERHRGRLEIASRVGIGTTVTVVLPPIRAGHAVTKP